MTVVTCIDYGQNVIQHTSVKVSGVPRGGGVGGFNTHTHTHTRNSEDIGGVLDHMSKNNRRLDFLL